MKYVPLPHHELPVLIYQSDNSPPIHVVHTPRPASYAPPAKQSYQEKPKYSPPPPPKTTKKPPPVYKPKPTKPGEELEILLFAICSLKPSNFPHC